MTDALGALRPYRRGSPNEGIEDLYKRISREVGRQVEFGDVDDLEDIEEDEPKGWKPDPKQLTAVLNEGVALLRSSADAKWRAIHTKLLKEAGNEKVVLFAQPIETVTALSAFLERETGVRPALIIGNQEEAERAKEIESFWRPDGPQYLVSSRAGGEGLNLQIARRLIHVDVPWNPMEMEQRVGRVHRFKSKRTVIVDTVVVKDTREVDTLRVSRDKLREIASAMVPEDRFESLYSRVMALVPPDELQAVLAEGPLGPMSDDEIRRIGVLVAEGFQRWRSFHDNYAASERQIRALDAGQARWDDVAAFIGDAFNAKSVPGFTTLKFQFDGDAVKEASGDALVFEVEQGFLACGDYGGMPVSRADGKGAAQLGINQPQVGPALRAAALPADTTGAAYVRWPAGVSVPESLGARPSGVLVLARQAVRLSPGSQSDAGVTLHTYVVGNAGATEVSRGVGAELIRGLRSAPAKVDPQADTALIGRMLAEETRLTRELRVPSEADRAADLRFAMFPIMAAIVE